MQFRIPYITPKEQRIIELIATGKRHSEIIKEVGPLPSWSMADLRQRTGIANTKDARFSREYLAAFEQSLSAPPLTPEERASLSYVAENGFPKDISLLSPGKSSSEALALFERAAAKVGIFTRHHAELRTQCRAYFLFQKPAPVLTDLQEKVLRCYASGIHLWDIRDHVSDHRGEPLKPRAVNQLLSDGCKALGVISRGRGVQRRLVAIALERMKTLQIDPLDAY